MNIAHCIWVLLVMPLFLFFASSAFGAESMTPGEWISVSKVKESEGVKVYGGKVIGNCDTGDWIAFGPLEFDDGLVDRIEMDLAAPGDAGSISVHLDSVTGSKIGEVKIRDTGGYNKFAVQQGDSEQLAGTHRLVLVFKGGKNLCNIKAVRFLKPGQKGSATTKQADSKKTASKDIKDEIESVIKANQEAIEKNRTTLITVKTEPGARVSVKQMRHYFEFGTAINRSAFLPSKNIEEADQAKYKSVVLDNFNSVVHENAMKWYSNEREQDKLNFKAADVMLKWAEEHGLYTRGHCVYWGRDKLVPKWQKEIDNEALRLKLEERAKVYMTRYKGSILEHDMNNEMVHCNYYKKRLGDDIWKQMFEWCREYDPGASLYVNDYSILSGGDTGKYVKQIEDFIKDGVKLGGIGVQGHFGSKVSPDKVKEKLDKLAAFGLPIKITEFDVNTPNESAKAVALVNLYTAAFAHPAVKGVYMWGFWRKKHWRPNAALWNDDWSMTPSAKWYRELVFKRWWTDKEAEANDEGACTVRVFYGQQNVTVNGKTRKFDITPDAAGTVIDCTGEDPAEWVVKTPAAEE